MTRWLFCMAAAMVWLQSYGAGPAPLGVLPLAERRWFVTRTVHFEIYSCTEPGDAYRLASQLEHFCEAYSLLAGAQAVASPPIVVITFPDHKSMRPFLPLYQGKPANLAGFFSHGSDESLIALSAPSDRSQITEMEVIFHEYAHVLFRYYGRIWPVWLSEGMADCYSTFSADGHVITLAKPIEPYLRVLSEEPLLSLHDLFAVTRDSPQYNERDRQGILYAESWLLTHYLIAGDNAQYKARFPQFSRLLQNGIPPEEAFTRALGNSLPAIESDLRAYLARRSISPIQVSLPETMASTIPMNARYIGSAETCFRLGDELLRVDQLDKAESYFKKARTEAPAGPLGFEGLGLLESERDHHGEACRQLKEALQHGSTSFLAHYAYAREKYRSLAVGEDQYAPLKKEDAAELHDELAKSLAIMPSFGPAHELLGFLEMAQGEDLSEAERHLRAAIQLEPENASYLLSLAQLQIQNRNPAAARRTLQPLLLPGTESKLRAYAEALIRETNAASAPSSK